MNAFDTAVRAAQEAADAWSRAAAAAGVAITLTQYRVLVAIDNANRAVEPPSQNDIVGVTKVDRSTLGELLQRLVDRGLVTRKRNKDDAREWLLRLFTDGAAMLKLCHGIHKTALATLNGRVSGLDDVTFAEAA